MPRHDDDETPEPSGPKCQFAAEHPAFRERLRDLERRMEKIETTQNEKWDALWKMVSDLRADLGHLTGRVAGYLLAAGLLGAVVAIIAQLAIGHVATDKVTSQRDVPGATYRNGGAP